MDYEMEELVPIVGKLAEKYTSHESTSITYEKAKQLMGAVLYCIHELWESSGNAPSLNKKLSAQRAYEMGAAYVRDKTGKALDLYNRILPEFCHYENKCLYDTFVKGIPEFFKWYDVQFEPQNTILTLDYPLLKDISEYTGIDKIFEFIKAIGLEQKFLKLFPAGYVINILSKDNRNWQESMDNICEIVFTHVIGHIMLGKSLTVIELKETDYFYMQEMFEQIALEDIKKHLEVTLEIYIKNYYENDRELLNYLSGAISGIVVRLKNAADNKVLGNII